MKLVLDANIFVSASIWGGNPRKIIKRLTDGVDTLFIAEDIVDEIEAVLKRPKFGLNDENVEQIIADIRRLGEKVAVSPEHLAIGASRDPKDDKYIECALAAGADCIISGDIHLLELKEYRGIKIVTVKEYLCIVTEVVSLDPGNEAAKKSL
jgi:putative PIN family toxin of toxin-antitoxin system